MTDDVAAGPILSLQRLAPGEPPPALGDATHAWWIPGALDSAPRARRGRIDALLRSVLAPYLCMAPGDLVFGREMRGRPFLRHDGAPDFNLSDTVGGTLVAVCGAGRVGVDLERLDRTPPVLKLARRWFAAAEAQHLASLTADAARVQFLHWWTAKESSCKATGTGIFGWLPEWRFAPEFQPRVLALPTHAGEASRWRLARIAPAIDYTAVLSWRDAPVDVADRVAAFSPPDIAAR